MFVVDDDAALRTTVADTLEERGYLVLPARQGEEALSRMRRFVPSAIAVVDMVMPHMDGWATGAGTSGDMGNDK